MTKTISGQLKRAISAISEAHRIMRGIMSPYPMSSLLALTQLKYFERNDTMVVGTKPNYAPAHPTSTPMNQVKTVAERDPNGIYAGLDSIEVCISEYEKFLDAAFIKFDPIMVIGPTPEEQKSNYEAQLSNAAAVIHSMNMRLLRLNQKFELLINSVKI